MMRVEMVGGPFDGHTYILKEDMRYIRFAGLADTNPENWVATPTSNPMPEPSRFVYYEYVQTTRRNAKGNYLYVYSELMRKR